MAKSVTKKHDESVSPTKNTTTTTTTTSKSTLAKEDEHPDEQESCLKKSLQTIVVILIIIGVMIYINPSRITPTPFDPLPLPSVPVSYDLDKAETIFRALRRLKGPESIAVHPSNGFLYSGTKDGKIIRANLSKPYSSAPETVGVIGDPNAALPLPCGTYTTEPLCGRPLGMEIANFSKKVGKNEKTDDILFFADAYLGIVQYNTKRHELTMLVDKDFTTTSNERIRDAFFNDVAYDKVDNVIYFTITSTKFRLNDLFFDLLDLGANGLLCKFDFENGKVSIIAKNIAFANGIVLHPTKRILFVSELSRARILTVNIDTKSNKYGKTTVFAENLPLLPDNIAIVGDELWAAGVNLRVGDITNKDSIDVKQFPWFLNFSLFDFLAKYPKLRLFIAKALPPQFAHYFTGASPGGVVRIDVDSGKVIKLMLASKSHINSSTQGIGLSVASITPSKPNDNELPDDQIYIYMGGFTDGVNSMGRFTWDLKNKVAIQSNNPATNNEVREQYRRKFDNVPGEEPVQDYVRFK